LAAGICATKTGRLTEGALCDGAPAEMGWLRGTVAALAPTGMLSLPIT
jgi:hypothetical protein